MDITMLLKTLEAYRLNIRNAVRGLWNGEWDYFMFYDQMMLAIERGFTQAWYEGAKQYGILPSELSEEEHNALRAEVSKEIGFIDGLGTYVESHNRLSGGKLSTVYARAELWVKGYSRVRTLGATHAAKDQKQMWNIHPGEHCRSCLKLDKKVKRASYWRAHVTPKDWSLDCHEGCNCTLDPTNAPLSRGPLPIGF